MDVDRLPIAQSFLLEKGERFVEVFPMDQAGLRVRNLILLVVIVGAVLLVSIFAFCIRTPIWGNFLGVCAAVLAILFLSKIGMLPSILNRESASLVLTDRSLITPQAEQMGLREIISVELKNSALLIKATASPRSFAVHGLVDPEQAATAIRNARQS